MRNLKKLALVVAATGGLLFVGAGAANAAPHGDGDNIPVLSNFKELDWDDSPFCGTQVKTKDSAQQVSCPVTHVENSPHARVIIVTQ